MVEKLGSMIKNCSLKRKFIKTHPKLLTDQNYIPDNFCKLSELDLFYCVFNVKKHNKS